MTLTEELELITGKVIRGDITPVVYDIIKNSGITDLKGSKKNDNNILQPADGICDTHSKQVISFDDFIRRSKRL